MRMGRRLRYLGAAGALTVCAWVGLGWEETTIDHETRYLMFIKRHPTTQVIFRSYMDCDECDATSYKALSAERQAEFGELCRAKYGAEDPQVCDDIYMERRKLKLERLGVHR